MVILSHPTGNPNVRSDIRALERAGHLAAFYTTIAVPRALAQSRAWPDRFSRDLSRRIFDELPRSKIITSPGRELARLVARAAHLGVLTRHEVGWASWDSVYQALDHRLARDLEAGRVKASVVYAYEDSALETFRAARRLGLRTAYHLPSTYWRFRLQLLIEERERRPDWAATMAGLADSPEKHRRKDLELAEADCVIVASSFSRRSLECCPVPPVRIEVIPYGAPPAVTQPPRKKGERGRPLSALFVGNLTQSKGLADLDEAMEHVRGLATLTLVGRPGSNECSALDRVIRRHRWMPPVIHSQLLELMAAHDVLVLPSLAEGFGLVIAEALSRGLPVIATPHTGGPDMMTDGQEGFIVPIRDPEAIADRLARLAQDRDLLAMMSESALKTARRNPWKRYEERIVQITTGTQGATMAREAR